jgi:hypothetical protein
MNRNAFTSNVRTRSPHFGSILSGCKEVGGLLEQNSVESINSSGIITHSSWRPGMNTPGVDLEVPRAEAVTVRRDTLVVELNDGRTISAPLAWYPRLLHATLDERNNWRLIGKGHGIHWEDLDEDISVEGLLAGKPSGESQVSFKRWLGSRTAPSGTSVTRRSSRRSKLGG